MCIAAIARLNVAVIATFTQQVAHAVPTSRRLAGVGAVIGVGLVAVIAGFAFIDAPITAALDQTPIRATITHIGVRIVAFLKAFDAFL